MHSWNQYPQKTKDTAHSHNNSPITVLNHDLEQHHGSIKGNNHERIEIRQWLFPVGFMPARMQCCDGVVS